VQHGIAVLREGQNGLRVQQLKSNDEMAVMGNRDGLLFYQGFFAGV
jgi:hypothetical protein